MWSTSVLASHTRGARRDPARRVRARERRSLVTRIERLEDRAVPSTLTVLNLNDSAAGSLRQAVLDANAHPGADVIHFAAGLKGKIVLSSSSGELNITDDL